MEWKSRDSQMLVMPALAGLCQDSALIGCKMSSRAVALLLALFFIIDACRAAQQYSSAALSTHIDTLLAEYDREVPPQQLTVVTLALDVRHASVCDVCATMRLLADLKMVWEDSRLGWNVSEWEGDSILVSAERLWTPDVQLVGGGEERGAGGAGGAGGMRARVGPRGEVTRVARLDLVVPLALQLADWPRDTQQADFTFASRAHSIDELDLLISVNKNSVIIESGAWELESVSGATEKLRRPESGSARAARWAVRAARRGAARAAQHGAVLAAAALLLTAAMARPAPQRTPLAACATLVSALWLIAAIFAVPASSSTPRIVVVMCAECALGAMCAVGAAVAQGVARRAAPPPAALRTLLSKVSAVYTITPDPECLSESRSGAWAAATRLLDVVLTALIALTLLVLIAVYLLA